jgi:hypothetical protein
VSERKPILWAEHSGGTGPDIVKRGSSRARTDTLFWTVVVQMQILRREYSCGTVAG